MRKYTNYNVDTELMDVVGKQKPSTVDEVKVGKRNWLLIRYKKNKFWKKYTTAVGANVYLPDDDESTMFGFTLFYDKKDFDSFDFNDKILELSDIPLKKLNECSKENDLMGNPIGEDDQKMSEREEMYTISLFADRGWVYENEYVDACINTKLQSLMWELCDQEKILLCPPDSFNDETGFKIISRK